MLDVLAGLVHPGNIIADETSRWTTVTNKMGCTGS